MSAKAIKPEILYPGDTIGIITPASQMKVEKLNLGIKYLQNLGYNVLLGKHVKDSYGYLAGKDQDRINDLHEMFANPEVKAIISSQGGYGTPRLLDEIDYYLIAQNPKLFIGYSDLTALQLAIWRQTGLVTFSGPMVAVEMAAGIEKFTEDFFWPLICDDQISQFYPTKPDDPLQVVEPGKAQGFLLGGCLSLISCVIGTKHQPDFSGSILILEDIGEQPYRIDRYLCQMKSAGILDQVNGIILGQFIDCVDEEDSPTLTLDEIFDDFFSQLSIPVVKSFPYGHGVKKFTIPFGANVEIDTSIPQVKLLESPVIKKVV